MPMATSINELYGTKTPLEHAVRTRNEKIMAHLLKRGACGVLPASHFERCLSNMPKQISKNIVLSVCRRIAKLQCKLKRVVIFFVASVFNRLFLLTVASVVLRDVMRNSTICVWCQGKISRTTFARSKKLKSINRKKTKPSRIYDKNWTCLKACRKRMIPSLKPLSVQKRENAISKNRGA